ncbi:hypothetical protein D8674_013522 [Pyrus ussuriensis x Pyrus communis]|uniref:BED-type domain-containing protein n=1 Tax=Pyrus ussuriensis x Pyrus communis TaxID=2448454 RepID=A0A5N5GSK4_9ROSA|nr:hypothetical protein D8674_013522 [Pyrus ussuriensis x Pyrus communis]
MIGTSSSGASTAMSCSSQFENVLKRSSEDVGWEYGILANPTNSDKVKCKLCNKIISGGVHRLKHVANIRGNVAACTKSSDEDKAKCRVVLEEAKNKKKQRDKHIVEVREEVQLQQIQEEEENIEAIGSRKRPRTLGPMDNIQHDPIVMEGILTCVEKFFPDNYEVQNQVINVEMHKYKVKEGGFGRHLAEFGCVENDENYSLELELGLGIGETSEVGSSLEPRRSSKNVEVRELHEEDFISDEDTEEEEGDDEEIEFESDTERVLEGYGEEEFDA